MSVPTYQELIELLNQAEKDTTDPRSVFSTAEVLTTAFVQRYPHIRISRPGRFLETVHRISSPLRHRKWTAKLTKEDYLKQEWSPRIRSSGTMGKLHSFCIM